MSEIYENVEVLEIPNDGESDDDVENSEDEYSIAEDGLPVESMEYRWMIIIVTWIAICTASLMSMMTFL